MVKDVKLKNKKKNKQKNWTAGSVGTTKSVDQQASRSGTNR